MVNERTEAPVPPLVAGNFTDDGIFSPWIVVYGIPQFLVWSIGLFLAAWSYRARTRDHGQRRDLGHLPFTANGKCPRFRDDARRPGLRA
ncbi:hypothetical protein [Micromonospora sp. NPDC005707]|uniref:hypothetical protein n=1 Tax=Micromonospora sp. NPDC005707 TaxID=3157050 RepID=UPI0033DF2A1E